MSSKPKILFVYDLDPNKSWMDGLWAALRLLEADYELNELNVREKGDRPDDTNYDFILGWGAFNSKVDHIMQTQFTKPKGLCIGGNTFPPAGADNYDVLFYETKWYRPQISFHKNIVHAFGVNTDIYSKPSVPMPIVWDYIGVGAFASWKRWEKMIDKKGNRLVIGEYQLGNEQESLGIIRDLVVNGVMVSNILSPYDHANLLNWSRTLYIPANESGGGERAVLEARACGLEVEIEDDNLKLKELLDSPIYDHHYYAEQLKKGIQSIL